MKRILRVFPERTAYTPSDELAVIGEPGLLAPPEFDEIHISCTFTWHLKWADEIAQAWARKYPAVHTMKGGPACGDPGREFVPGRYVRYGISISSRGCPNNCDFCLVPKREGKLRLLPICPGNIVNDNNATAWPRHHWRMLIAMLKTQRRIEFKGGLEAARLRGWHWHGLQDLDPSSITEIWFAADTDAALKPLARAAKRLQIMFERYADRGRRKMRCYVLIGRDSIASCEARLEQCWELGFLPFAQLFQGEEGRKDYGPEWRALERKWARPALMFAAHK